MPRIVHSTPKFVLDNVMRREQRKMTVEFPLMLSFTFVKKLRSARAPPVHRRWPVPQRWPQVRPVTNVLEDRLYDQTLTIPSTKAQNSSCQNNHNTKMACNSIAADIFIRTVFGYSFKDLNLLDEALDTTGTTRVGSNQSLALIGDSVLQAVIYRDWYSSGQPKGTGSQLLQSLSSNFNLAKVARNIGLDKHIVRHRSQASSAPSERTLATTLEAVLGAIDCDSGESADAVRSAMKMIGLSAEASKSISSTRQ